MSLPYQLAAALLDNLGQQPRIGLRRVALDTFGAQFVEQAVGLSQVGVLTHHQRLDGNELHLLGTEHFLIETADIRRVAEPLGDHPHGRPSAVTAVFEENRPADVFFGKLGAQFVARAENARIVAAHEERPDRRRACGTRQLENRTGVRLVQPEVLHLAKLGDAYGTQGVAGIDVGVGVLFVVERNPRTERIDRGLRNVCRRVGRLVVGRQVGSRYRQHVVRAGEVGHNLLVACADFVARGIAHHVVMADVRDAQRVVVRKIGEEAEQLEMRIGAEEVSRAERHLQRGFLLGVERLHFRAVVKHAVGLIDDTVVMRPQAADVARRGGVDPAGKVGSCATRIAALHAVVGDIFRNGKFRAQAGLAVDADHGLMDVLHVAERLVGADHVRGIEVGIVT